MSEQDNLQKEHQQYIGSLGDFKRTHMCGDLRESHIGETVRLAGWVQFRRDHGGLIFIDLRDRGGLTQVVFEPDEAPAEHERAKIIRAEYVIAIEGYVRKRPEGMTNSAMPTGDVEIVVTRWTLLNTSLTPPFPIEDRVDAGENLRLQYRYLDLRRKRMAQNLILRHKVGNAARRYLDEQGFLEVETPFLTKSTPEGARDFLVPSRVNQGEFYALPQSPQIFKQLLMVGGVDRYFQIARCFRDEDLRADRQPEFTQIDLEMSFVDEEDVMGVAEGLVKRVFTDVMDKELPDAFPRMTFGEAMEKYGVDKPDTRFGLLLHDVTDIVRGSGFRLFSAATLVKAMRVPGGEGMSRKEIDDYTEYVKIFGAQGLAWIKIRDNEWQSPIAKFLSDEERAGLTSALGLEVGDIVFFQAGEPEMVNAALGNLRVKLGHNLGLIEEGQFNFLWVTDFPLFEYDADEKRYVACHHPFTAPQEATRDKLTSEPGVVLARAYDLVLNGTELGGGSIRNYNSAVQREMFAALGFTKEEAESQFGFLIKGLEFGAPPHGGLAFGFDRMIMLLAGEDSIRDIIAFPKTQKATCLLSDAPSPVATKQLRELGIQLREKEKPTS